MSRFPEFLLTAALVSAALPAWADGLGLGRPALPEEIAAWDIDVRPDGQGLPVGSGNAIDGEELFTARCAVCHGDFGEAVGRWPVLAGGEDSLTADRPVKTIGSFWPYLSTVWDYVHRAMPFGDAQSLTADETYAITAYLMYLNYLVDEDYELSNENFFEVRLPNEEGFYPDDRETVEYPSFTREPCMTDCKESVEITMRSEVLDVTPEETRAAQLKAAVEAAKTGTQMAAAGTVETPAPEAPAAQPEPTPASAPAADPALAAEGEALFRQCKACHQVGDDAKNRVGPHLNGVLGRTAGTVDGFRYSKPMEDAGAGGLVWDETELAAFLMDPKGYMKGTKMSFRGLKSDAEANAMVEYLKTFDD